MYDPYLVSGPTKDGVMTSTTVEYRQAGSSTITETYRFDVFTVEGLKNIVRGRLAALNTVPENIAIGKLDTSVPTPPVDDPAKVAFMADFNKLGSWQMLSFAGVDVNAIQRFTDLKARIATVPKATIAQYLGL